MSLTKPIPKATRERISQDPYYKHCARTDDPEGHKGRITIEHAITYAGTRIDDYWALLPICEHHHLYGGLKKNVNQAIAISRATPEDRLKYPKMDWVRADAYMKLFLPKNDKKT